MDPGIEQVVRALFEGEDTTSRWSRVTAALGVYLNAYPVTVWALSGETREPFVETNSPGWPEVFLEEYRERFQATDPRLAAAYQHAGTTLSCVDSAPPDFEQSALVNELLDRRDVDARWSMVHLDRTSDGHVMVLAAGRSRQHGPFLEPEKMRFDLVLPFIKRSLELDARVAGLRRQQTTLTDTLDALSDAVIVVAPDLRVLHLNAKAAGLIGVGLGLRLKQSKLYAAQPAEHSALERIVTGALGSDVELAQTAILRSGKGAPILVRAYRLPTASGVAAPDHMRQCVLILRTGRHLDSGTDVILRSFGLTGAEVKLVRRLLQGARLRECAQEAGVSTETVRTQLKSAHQKIGVRRQSELIRLLSQYAH